MHDRGDRRPDLRAIRGVRDRAEPDPHVSGIRRRRAFGPPRREMVAAAHAIEPGLLGFDRLLQQLVRGEALVGERGEIAHVIGLPAARPKHAAHVR